MYLFFLSCVSEGATCKYRDLPEGYENSNTDEWYCSKSDSKRGIGLPSGTDKRTDPDCMKLASVSRTTFYKYKKELKSDN